MATVNKYNLDVLTTALRREFLDGLQQKKPTWSQIAMRIPSTTATNYYAWLGNVPKMREWVGERQLNKLKDETFYIVNKPFESTISVPRTDIEDDQIGMHRLDAYGLGEAAALLPDQLVWSLLKNGTTERCYDGQCFFDTEHPLYPNTDGTGTAAFQSNLTKGSDADAVTWYVVDDTSRYMPLIWQEREKPELTAKTNPDSDHVFMLDQYLFGARARGNAGYGFWQLAHAAVNTQLTEENLQNVITSMAELKSHGGGSLDIRPSKLIVPPALRFRAEEILKRTAVRGTDNVMHKILSLHVESRLI